jgi:hypothetical protein
MALEVSDAAGRQSTTNKLDVHISPEHSSIFRVSHNAGDNAVKRAGLPSASDLLGHDNRFTPRPDGPNNPPPESWKRDAQGHLLQAGNRYNAEYDNKGNLVKAQLGDHTYERTGPNEVTMTTRDDDGKLRSNKINDVTGFSASEAAGNFGGPFNSIEVRINYGESSYQAQSTPVYESAAHQRAFFNYLNSK